MLPTAHRGHRFWRSLRIGLHFYSWASLVAQTVKKSAHKAGDLDLIPGQEDSLEKETATHSSILA